MLRRTQILLGCVLLFWLFAVDSSEAQKNIVGQLQLQLPMLRYPPTEVGLLKRRLLEWQTTFRRGQRSLIRQSIKDLRDLQRSLGVRNLFTFSAILLQHGKALQKKGKLTEARYYFEEARKFSPLMAEPHFCLASLTFKESPLAVVSAVSGWVRGVRLWFGDFLGFAVFWVKLGVVLWVALGILFALFLPLVLVRTLRPFLHDFQALFPKGVSSFQIRLLSLFLLFLPPLMGGGLLETLLLWSFLSWFYLSRIERILTTVGFLLLSAMVFTLPILNGFASRMDSPKRQLFLLNETDLQHEAAPKVKAYLDKKPRSFYHLWSMGLYQKRRGDVKGARAYFERALRVRRDPAIFVNLANLDFAERDGVEAYKRYTRARKMRSRMPEAHYNLSILFKHSRSTSLVQYQVDMLEAARGLARQRVERFRKGSKKQLNRYLMDIYPPVHIYRKSDNKQDNVLVAGVWSSLARWIPLDYAPFSGLAVAVLFWLLLPVGRLAFHGEACHQCGRVHTPHNKEDEGLCERCVHLFVRKDGVSVRRRVELEFSIARYQRWRFRLLAVFSVLCMGAGHIIKGATVRGFSLLALLSIFLSLWWTSSPILSHPLQSNAATPFFLLVGWGVLCVLMYALSVREIFRDR